MCVVHRCYIDVSDTPESELMGVKIFFRGLVHCSLSGGLGKRKTTFRPRGAWRPSGPPASLYLPSSQAKPRPHRAGARAPAFASEKRLRSQPGPHSCRADPAHRHRKKTSQRHGGALTLPLPLPGSFCTYVVLLTSWGTKTEKSPNRRRLVAGEEDVPSWILRGVRWRA